MPARLQTEKKIQFVVFSQKAEIKLQQSTFQRPFRRVIWNQNFSYQLPPLSTGLTLDFKLCFQTPMPEIKTSPSKRGGGSSILKCPSVYLHGRLELFKASSHGLQSLSNVRSSSFLPHYRLFLPSFLKRRLLLA